VQVLCVPLRFVPVPPTVPTEEPGHPQLYRRLPFYVLGSEQLFVAQAHRRRGTVFTFCARCVIPRTIRLNLALLNLDVA
jgi:hypothetical protein